MLSAFCNHYSPVESQILRNRELSSSFVLTMRNRCVRLTKHLKTVLCCDNVLSRTQPLKSIYTTSSQTVVADFQFLDCMSSSGLVEIWMKCIKSSMRT